MNRMWIGPSSRPSKFMKPRAIASSMRPRLTCIAEAKNDATLRECGLGNLSLDKEEAAKEKPARAASGVAVTSPDEWPPRPLKQRDPVHRAWGPVSLSGAGTSPDRAVV